MASAFSSGQEEISREKIDNLLANAARLPYENANPSRSAADFWREELMALPELESGFRLWTVEREGRLDAAAWGWRLDWASAYFGLEMFSIDGAALRAGADAARLAEELAGSALEDLHKAGYRHVAAQCLADDGGMAGAFERAGMTRASHTVTHVLEENRRPDSPEGFPPPGDEIGGWRQGDEARLTALAAGSDIPSAFHGDPYLDPDLLNDYYARRIENICEPDNRKGLYVWRRGETAVGFDAHKADRRLECLLNRRVAFKMMTVLSRDLVGRGLGARFLDFVHSRIFRECGVIAGRIQASNKPMAGALRSIGARVIAEQYSYVKRFES